MMATRNAQRVRSLKETGKYGDQHGLMLRVTPTGSKQWIWRGTIRGRRRDLGLGGYPYVTLKEARTKAFEYRRIARQGGNPTAGRSTVPTFREATEKVIQLHAPKWKPGGLSERHWRSTLETYAFPHLGDMAVNQITGADVMACLAPIWNRTEETARRVLQRVSAVMRWAVAQGFREDNPADRRIKAALGSNSAKAQHFKALHHSQVAQALTTIRATSAWKATVLCFEFLTLCAVRSGAARLATWDEIDLATATWTIPATRPKTSTPHRVPLLTPALAVLEHAREQTGGVGLIFPAPRGKPISNATMSKLCKENNIGCVPHGMRSSFRDWCGETGVSRELAEAALAHTVKGVEGAYARSDLLERRRKLMEQWGHYLQT